MKHNWSLRRAVIAILCAVAALGAQAQLRWGAQAGLTVSDLKFKQNLFAVDQRCGASAGVMGELMFPGLGFGINVGLGYSMLGAETHLGDKLLWESQGYTSERIFLHTIQVPLNLRFKWTRMQGLEDYVAPFAFGGPVFDFIVGHSRCEAFKYTGGDVGLTAGLGVELFKRWQVSASYTWGMTYVLKTSLLTDLSARSRCWDVRVTYFF